MPRTIDDLTRDFRAAQRGPLPDAVETILHRATTPPPDASPQRAGVCRADGSRSSPQRARPSGRSPPP